jgi:protein-L-isoaspartate(D-aspartate) O-methyltransferase
VADRTSEPPHDPDWTSERARMVREQLADRGIRDPLVLWAMGQVPRERFLPLAVRRRAYEDGAQAIGHGQTISQPFIVARMSEALHLPAWQAAHPGAVPHLLDVGTGSGYQAAVLAAMGARVTTIERDPELAERAAGVLVQLGIEVHGVVGDGSEGYPPDAPYAGIVVAAAAPAVPEPLVQQLVPDGRLVLPIGPRDRQELTVVFREGDRVVRRQLEPAVFVPLLGRFGQDSPLD